MAKRVPIPTAKPAETCVLIGLATRLQRREQLEEYLEELAFLALTAKAQTDRVLWNINHAGGLRIASGNGSHCHSGSLA